MCLPHSEAGSPGTTCTTAYSGVKLSSVQSSPSEVSFQAVMPHYTALSYADRQNASNASRNCGELLFCAKKPIRCLHRLSSTFM